LKRVQQEKVHPHMSPDLPAMIIVDPDMGIAAAEAAASAFMPELSIPGGPG
jgi:hypothetical protein